MINFRNIFNTTYSLIGLILIIMIIGFIILINQNIKRSCKKIGKSFFISGVITIILSFLVKIVSNLLIPDKYQIITNVIIKNIVKNMNIYSLISILIGLVFMILSLVIKEKSIEKT